MKMKLLFIALFMLPVIIVLADKVNFDLSNTGTYSLTSNLTASYDGSTNTLWLTHSNDGQPGVFTLETVANVGTFNSFTFDYDQTGNGGKVKYQAGNGTAFQPYGTVKKSDTTIPTIGGTIGTSGKFTITIQSGVTLQSGYSGHVGISKFSGMEKEILPEGYVSIGGLPFYNGVDGDGNPIATTAAVAATAQTKGQSLIAGTGSTGGGDKYYDLENYGEIKMKLTCADEHIGKTVSIRYFFMKASDPAQITTITINRTFDATKALIIDLDVAGEYTNNNIETRKLIGISTQGSWSTVIPDNFPFNISYVMVQVVAPTALAVVPENVVLAQALPIGSSTTLTTQFTPSNTTNKAVIWSSANEGIATVDASTGVVTGVAAGSVKITATSGEDSSIKGDYTITVAASTVAVTGVELALSTLSLKMLNDATLAYTISPGDASNRNVTWESSNTGVATVDGTGKVTPVGAGTTTISVKTENGEFTDACEVTVIGDLPIPEGYVSLYTLNYMFDGTSESLSGNKGAALPAIFSSNGASLLGWSSNWNRNNRYVNLLNYDELQIACYFKTEDIGKTFDLRYCFSGTSEDATSTTLIQPAIVITSENQKITIDLANDEGDTENLRRLGAIKFRNGASGEVKFNVDYVAIKPSLQTSIQQSVEQNDPVIAIKYYNLRGMEIPQTPEEGVYIVKKTHASQKISMTKEIKIKK